MKGTVGLMIILSDVSLQINTTKAAVNKIGQKGKSISLWLEWRTWSRKLYVRGMSVGMRYHSQVETLLIMCHFVCSIILKSKDNNGGINYFMPYCCLYQVGWLTVLLELYDFQQSTICGEISDYQPSLKSECLPGDHVEIEHGYRAHYSQQQLLADIAPPVLMSWLLMLLWLL